MRRWDGHEREVGRIAKEVGFENVVLSSQTISMPKMLQRGSTGEDAGGDGGDGVDVDGGGDEDNGDDDGGDDGDDSDNSDENYDKNDEDELEKLNL